MRPSEKELLEQNKLKAEIEKLTQETIKISRESRVARWNWLRFLLGSFIVPLAVAFGTYEAIHSTGYFSAWQKQNENAQFKFAQDTSAFAYKREALLRFNDSIQKQNDSLTNENSKIQIQDLKYKRLIESGLSRDQKLNTLIAENSVLHRIIDSANGASRNWQTLYNSVSRSNLAANPNNWKTAYDSLFRVFAKTRDERDLAQNKEYSLEYDKSKIMEYNSMMQMNYQDTIRQLREQLKKKQ